MMKAAHRKWVQSNSTEGARLTLEGVSLRGVDWQGAVLSAALVRRTCLYEADLSVANMALIDLTGSDLRMAKLIEADLRGARLGGAHCNEADLTDANLSPLS